MRRFGVVVANLVHFLFPDGLVDTVDDRLQAGDGLVLFGDDLVELVVLVLEMSQI